MRHTAVKGVSRIGNRLSVMIHFDGRDHLTLLQEWIEPPTIDELDTALRTMLGRRVWEIGQVDIQPASRETRARSYHSAAAWRVQPGAWPPSRSVLLAPPGNAQGGC